MKVSVAALLLTPVVVSGSGVQFSRTVTSIADDSSFALKFDSGEGRAPCAVRRGASLLPPSI